MFRSHSKLIVYFVAGLFLASCGFHLRGYSQSSGPLAFKTVCLNFPQAAIYPYLKRALATDARIILVNSPSEADAIFDIADEALGRDIITINRTGTASQYQLTYRIAFRLSIKGETIEPNMVFTVRRELNYSDQAVLGKAQEEELLWNDMRRDVVRMLIYRIYALETIKPKPSASAPVISPNAYR